MKIQEILIEASGYIPSEAQKDDPRFKTALTVDVHPDSIQQNAKKLGSKIARTGVPPTLKASGKVCEDELDEQFISKAVSNTETPAKKRAKAKLNQLVRKY